MTIPKIPRECSTCCQCFKPMSDKQWEIVKYEHEIMSKRHKRYLGLSQLSQKPQLEGQKKLNVGGARLNTSSKQHCGYSM